MMYSEGGLKNVRGPGRELKRGKGGAGRKGSPHRTVSKISCCMSNPSKGYGLTVGDDNEEAEYTSGRKDAVSTHAQNH